MTGPESKSARHPLLFALSHPTRQRILKEMWGEAKLSPQECSQRMRVQLSHVSYHFRVLDNCKAIILVKTEPIRGSLKHYYRFTIEEPWALEALGLPSPGLPSDGDGHLR